MSNIQGRRRQTTATPSHVITCDTLAKLALRKILPLRQAGVRVPDQGFAREVCRRAGGALALTSANFSGGTSPLQVRRPALCPLPGRAKA